jgi:hypothetical protein
MRVGALCGIWVGAGVGWCRAQRSPTCGVRVILQNLIDRDSNNRITLNDPIIALIRMFAVNVGLHFALHQPTIWPMIRNYSS